MAKCLDHQDLAHFIKPRLRIFFSVDLIGSTEYKISHIADQPTDGSWWPLVSMLFYTDFQKKFIENWQDFERAAGAKISVGPQPKLWKALGDELIFYKECVNQDEVVAAVQVWRRTVLDFKANWLHPELRFKTGGWLVGTPVRNWEVAFAHDEPDDMDVLLSGQSTAYNFNLLRQYYDPGLTRKIDIDFIGPSMDCGFRILGFADERRFVMSADLAYLISARVGTWNENGFGDQYPAIDFYFLGNQELKGYSRSGFDYPVFWLDAFALCKESDSVVHAKMVDVLDPPRQVSSAQVKEALEPFLKQFGGPPDIPYICSVAPGDGRIKNMMNAIPDDHIEEINRLRLDYVAMSGLETSVKESSASENPGNGEVALSGKDIEKAISKLLTSITSLRQKK
jgi:hypothetical protein